MHTHYSRQDTHHYCGPATLQMTLARFGIHVSQDELAREARTNKEIGTMTEHMVAVLRTYGLTADARELWSLEEIRSFLGAERIIIVCYTEVAAEEGHYAILSTLDDKTIELCDPYHGPCFIIPREEFEKRWRDPHYTKTKHWAAVVARPVVARPVFSNP